MKKLTAFGGHRIRRRHERTNRSDSVVAIFPSRLIVLASDRRIIGVVRTDQWSFEQLMNLSIEQLVHDPKQCMTRKFAGNYIKTAKPTYKSCNSHLYKT